MIGSNIKGVGMDGQPCEGIVLDKILILQRLSIKAGPLQPAQEMPIPLDAYLVQNPETKTIHFVPPGQISQIHHQYVFARKWQIDELDQLHAERNQWRSDKQRIEILQNQLKQLTDCMMDSIMEKQELDNAAREFIKVTS